MWRPDEKVWIKLKREYCKLISGSKADCKHCPTEPMKCNRSLEAGADAMLEALFKLAKESPTKTFTIDSRTVNVFMEDKNE